ncbi:MAG: ornithine cyclodeaminase family protein [Conexivisphaera sp.]
MGGKHEYAMELAMISRDTLSREVDIGRIVEAIEEGFLRDDARAEPRIIADTGRGTMLVMTAHDAAYSIVKYIGIYPGNTGLGLPTASSIVLLAESSTGVPVAAVDGSLLTVYRTGATSAVVAKHLLRGGSLTVGFIGSGLQARAHAAALRSALGSRIVRALTYDVDGARAEALASALRRDMSLEASVAEDPDYLVISSDLVVATTTSRSPVFHGDILADGRHRLIISIGWLDVNSTEVDRETVRRSSMIVVDTEAALSESAEIRNALESMDTAHERILTLAELLRRTRSGNLSSPIGTVLYKGVGTALEDLFAAESVYRSLRNSANRVTL